METAPMALACALLMIQILPSRGFIAPLRLPSALVHQGPETRQISLRNGASCQIPRGRVGTDVVTSRVMNRDVKPEVVEESEEEIDSHFLKQSIIVDASIDECYGAAADLDDYATWCRKGGMKKVKVLDRNDDGMCSKVEFTAGKLGIDMVNVVEYSYEAPRLVKFHSISGDIMKTLDGCFRFETLGGGDTKMTYELLLEFGFVIPEFARKQIVGAIMQTALESLKDHIEKKKR
ncbi:hypothetical protein GUITHDRAFT_149861 [Guillardia theta CCMP2712]|uniref:Coenzyme Q-binding protein COQ10 START domain-containing protein n=1 Tax=Guillardia theta (strain CCMP2712) TaxID=905079 RepID=L1K380_GUITC|nr:hypothetical protein GUITHDRAFT_149861 [Guillardia theta CCMP2712]EKX54803.1 hypothetical protein GUITHDRAFT_149861 [Guillardia theta CCMP2712]|eukprot:XP_005841783.1 hypothetical protein GUITHDRAFT_149861 [Guillardia theta CCMP2712]